MCVCDWQAYARLYEINPLQLYPVICSHRSVVAFVAIESDTHLLVWLLYNISVLQISTMTDLSAQLHRQEADDDDDDDEQVDMVVYSAKQLRL
jgi:hypothetical protein